MSGKLLTTKCLYLFTTILVVSCYGDINILTNPGFESGLTGWSARNCSIVAESGIVRTGSGSAKVYNRTATWNGIKQDILSDVESGETYQISGWVRLENTSSATVTVSIQQTDDSGTHYYNIDSATANNSSWVQLSGQFTYSPTGTATILYVYFEGPTADANFFADDVIVYGPSSSTPWTPPEPNATGQINLDTRYQELDGFGASGAWYEELLSDNPEANDIYDLLFDDLGIDIYRLRNTYDQGTSGDDYMSRSGQIVTAAKLRNPNLEIMMACWSPPTYLKSNGELAGGTLDGGPSSYMYSELAEWWADSLDAWSALGVDVNYISLQNEPDYTASWDTCRYEPTQTSSYAGYDQAFEAVYDEIYSRMGPNMPKMLGSDAAGILGAGEYLDNLINTSHVYGYAHHLYNIASWDDPDAYLTAMAAFNTNYGSKPLIQTEYSGGSEVSTHTDAMNLALLLHNSLVTESVSCYLHWELFWPSPKGLVSVSASDYTINTIYYAFKHYSAFTDPGWQRVDCNDSSSALRMSAYVRPDSQKMSVIIINTSSDTNIALNLSFQGFSVTNGNVYRTSETENCALLGSFDKENSLQLPAETITTLYLSITPPAVVANAGSDITAYATADGYADVNMDGSGSYDINGLPLSYIWSWTADGNDYEVNGVSPSIQLPLDTVVQRRGGIAYVNTEHTIQLIADNNTEQSSPDYCTVNVIAPLKCKIKCKPRSIKTGRIKGTTLAVCLETTKGIGASEIDLGEPLTFYPGGIQALTQSASEKGRAPKQKTKIAATFDLYDCIAQLSIGGNTVQIVGKFTSGRYFYATAGIKMK